MSKRDFETLIGFFIVAACLFITAGDSQAADRRPNILLIMADDMGVECVGAYGGLSYETPHLDRMAATGLRFENAFATPLCSTTRVELMTGRSSQRDWIGFGLLNPRSRTFGHALRAAGYQTGIIGKWQLTSYDPPDYPGAELRRNTGMPPNDAGFDEFVLFHTGHTELKGSRYADPTLDFNGDVRTLTNDYGPDVFVRECQRFIKDRTSNESPWFLYYPMALPHWPMVPTPKSEAWTDRSRRSEESTGYFPDMVSYTDDVVGKLLETVHASSDERPTLVLFYGDNGTHLKIASNTVDGWKPGGKGLSTDAGTRVPLLAHRTDAQIAVGTTEALVAPVDFFTTFLDIAEAYVSSDDLDSMSFASVLDGKPGQRTSWTCHYEPRPGWDKDQFTKLVFTQDARYKLYSDGRFYDTLMDAYENRPIPLNERNEDETEAATMLAAEMAAALQPKPID